MQMGNGVDIQSGVLNHILHMRAMLTAVHHRQFDDATFQRQRRALLPRLQQALAQPGKVAGWRAEGEHQVVHAGHGFVDLGPLRGL